MGTLKTYKEIKANLESLLIYRNIRDDQVIKSIEAMFKETKRDTPSNTFLSSQYNTVLGDLVCFAEERAYKGNLLSNYVLDLILNDSNVFAQSCEKYGDNIESCLKDLAIKDLRTIFSIMHLDFMSFKNMSKINGDFILDYNPTLNKHLYKPYNEEKNFLCQTDCFDDFFNSLVQYYHKIGSGILSSNIAFKWVDDFGIVPVHNPHKIELNHIIGCAYQKDMLIKNTDAFIKGHTANNVLLEGSRGTGKSSLVKALLNYFHTDGLRLIEVGKTQFLHLSTIMNELSKKNKPFILFLDDISFEDTEIEYKQMKSILDGGIETKPSNVLIYATSNRRHLVKEKWEDAPTLSNVGEIHSNDSVNEKLSLSDRFGLTLTFVKPTQKEYLDIVFGLVEQKNIDLPQDYIKQEAIKWELNQNGRSGRTAEQFINHLISEHSIL